MWRRLALLVPPGWAAFAATVCVGFHFAPVVAFHYYFGSKGLDITSDSLSELREVQGFLTVVPLLITAVGFGIRRARAFHPALDLDYGTWLQTVPFDGRVELPQGPVHLTPADVALLLLLEGAAYGFGTPWPGVTTTFYAIGYGGTMAYLLGRSEAFGAAVAVVFSLGLAFANLHRPLVSMLASLAAYGAIAWSLTRSLTWLSNGFEGFAPVPKEAGWPTQALFPESAEEGTRTALAVVGILIGWGTYAFLAAFFRVTLHIEKGDPLWRPGEDWPYGAVWVSVVVTTIVAVSRLLVYLPGTRPPISLLGRIATRRWIVPGYDRVFLTPLIGLAVGCLLPSTLAVAGVPVMVAVPLSVSLAGAILLAGGPTLEAWRLTGEYRMVPSNRVLLEKV